jgi:hypothetical protein
MKERKSFVPSSRPFISLAKGYIPPATNPYSKPVILS